MSLILKNLLLQKVNDTCHHLSCKSLADRGCRRLMFLKSFEGQAFQRHVFKEIYLTMGIEPYSDCKNRCLMENSCVSVNIGPPDKNGLRVCQLSDSDPTQHPDDLKPQKGYICIGLQRCGKNGFYPMMFIYLFFLIKMLLKINLSM